MTVRALAFDVFGTVVDWRSSVIRELEQFGERHGLQRDWPTVADNWRAGYAPAMDRVRRGDLPWTRIDDLHRMILVELLDGAAVSDDDVDELNRAWHRLDPWPDPVERTFKHFNDKVYNTMQGPNEFLYTGNLKNWNRIAEMRRIAVPCLVVVGEFDELTPACALRMHQALPHSEIAVLRGCSHMPMYEDPETYFDLLTKFLAKVTA